MNRPFKPSKIVVHHSVSPRDADFDKSILSFDRNHALRLHKERDSLGYHVAYHYICGGSGELKQTRADNEVGYHGSNWLVNLQSIGICLVGNFDVEHPSTAQLATLQKLISDLKSKYNIDAKNVFGHREFAAKSCPGNNFTDKLLGEIAYGIHDLPPENAQPSDWAKQAWDIAVAKGIIQNGQPQGDLTVKDAEIILNRIGALNQVEGNLTRERFLLALFRLKPF